MYSQILRLSLNNLLLKTDYIDTIYQGNLNIFQHTFMYIKNIFHFICLCKCRCKFCCGFRIASWTASGFSPTRFSTQVVLRVSKCFLVPYRKKNSKRTYATFNSLLCKFWQHETNNETELITLRKARKYRRSHFSFSFVRNPFDRLIAAYNNKVVEIEEPPLPMQHMGIVDAHVPQYCFAVPAHRPGAQSSSSQSKEK